MESSFLQQMTSYKAELMKHKNNAKLAEAWTEDKEETLMIVNAVIQMCYTIGDVAAEDYFNENCALADYPSVTDYMSATSMAYMRYANKTSNKTKTKRLSSKITTCKACGGKTHIDGKTVVCDQCGETEVISSKAGKNKANNLKHTKNKIECLIGMMDPPHKIIELENYAAEWMLHLHWLYDWLEYKEKTFKITKTRFTKAKWLADLHAIYSKNPRDETGTWQMDLQPIEKYKWTYNE